MLSEEYYRYKPLRLMEISYKQFVEDFKEMAKKDLLLRYDLHEFKERDARNYLEEALFNLTLDFNLTFARNEIGIDREITEMTVAQALETYPYLRTSAHIDASVLNKTDQYISVSRIAYELPFKEEHDSQKSLHYSAGGEPLTCRGVIGSYQLFLEYAYLGPVAHNAEVIKRQMYYILEKLEENTEKLKVLQKRILKEFKAEMEVYLAGRITEVKKFRQDDHLFL